MVESVLDEDKGPLVPWDTIGQPRFDELVEALVPYQHPRGSRVDAIDGRGGDGGVDVAVLEPDPATGKVVRYRDEHGRLIVYQLKYFPQGFSGPFRDRRKQIKRSLNQAIKHNPAMADWVLVAPCRQTPGDRNYLDKLRESHPDLPITLVDRTALNGDAWVAGNQHVVRALFPRDELLEKAKILGHEKTVLAGGLLDLAERQRALDGVVDDSDPHWTWRVHTTPQGPETHVLFPKHPQAPDVSPVSVTLQVTDSPEGAAFRKALEFGSLQPIVLPGHAVTKLEVSGPPIVQSGHPELDALVRVELHRIVERGISIPLTLSLYDDNDALLHAYSGLGVDFEPGTRGAALQQAFYGGAFTIEWALPAPNHAATEAGQATFSFDLTKNRSTAGIRGVADLALTLDACDNARLTTAQGQLVAHVAISDHVLQKDERQQLVKLREIADDLAYLEREFAREFVFPDEVSTLARIDLRMLRQLLEGKVVCSPHLRTLHLQLQPEALNDPLYQRFFADPSGLIATAGEEHPQTWTIEAVRDQGTIAEVALPGVYKAYYPKLIAENADAVRAALAAGEDAQLDLREPAEMRPRAFLADRMTQDTVVPQPWGLTDVPEVPELRESADIAASPS